MRTQTLNDAMEFDCPVSVEPDGKISQAPQDIHAPQLTVDSDGTEWVEGPGVGWELLDGYSGQHGYSGPIMHPSEFIGGAMERDIMAEPGVYVVVAVDVLPTPDDPEPEPAGWCVARYVG